MGTACRRSPRRTTTWLVMARSGPTIGSAMEKRHIHWFVVLLISTLLRQAAPVRAQDHPCETDTVRTRGGQMAYRKECCMVRPYRALEQVARAEGIEIRRRLTAQEPQPGYFLCVADFAWQDSREAWRTDDANFLACVASVQKMEAERKRSAPDLFYTPHDLKCGHDLDKYLCALGNAWACKK